jgi:hypothetical protein
MIRVRPRRVLLASAFASALVAAPALAEPTPAAPAPVAMPYPNTSSPDPGATQEDGKIPTHKHIAGVKYEDRAAESAVSTAAGDAQLIEVQSISWGKVGDAGTVYSADPMEGGQIAARRYTPGKPTYGDATFNSAPVAAESKPTVSEIPITKQMDSSSSKLEAREPGKLEVPNVQVADPVAKTIATFTTLAGKCVKGRHLDKVVIVARSGRYTLRDAVVTDVTPAGDGMESVSLSYASLDK